MQSIFKLQEPRILKLSQSVSRVSTFNRSLTFQFLLSSRVHYNGHIDEIIDRVSGTSLAHIKQNFTSSIFILFSTRKKVFEPWLETRQSDRAGFGFFGPKNNAIANVYQNENHTVTRP